MVIFSASFIKFIQNYFKRGLRMYSRLFVLMFVLLFAVGCSAEEAKVAPELKLETPKDRISYTIGVNIGQDFKGQELDVDTDILLMGLKDSFNDKELKLTEEEMLAEIQAFQQKMQEKMVAEMEASAGKNQAAGEAFLAENANKEGVVVTESGLQYKVLEAGEGDSPGAADVATVHYRGTLIDGTQFDSSYDRGQPATFPVGGVIPGWTEAGSCLFLLLSHMVSVVPVRISGPTRLCFLTWN
jgi:FKBP-type peptidyl-prolyl cis-trans isomerase FklB